MGKSSIKLTPIPIKWSLLKDSYFSVDINAEAREQEDGSFLYAISSSSKTFLNLEVKAFCYDMKEDDKFFKETRHASLELALEAFKKYVEYCCELSMCQNTYEMAVQYHFNNKKVKANPIIIKRMKEAGLIVTE